MKKISNLYKDLKKRVTDYRNKRLQLQKRAIYFDLIWNNNNMTE